MKNIEKIGIESLIESFSVKNQELVNQLISAKAAAETAQSNYKKAASPILGQVKEIGSSLLADEVSEDAIKYFEEKITDLIKIPFTVSK
jgi:hypothetical protein